MGTKRPHGDAEAGKSATKMRTGRPPIGVSAMSSTERSARRRARQKAKPRPVKDANEIFECLCDSRNLTSAFHRVLAQQVTDALVEGRLSEALKGLDALPAPVRTETSSPGHGVSAAREQFIRQVMNAVVAHQIEVDEEMAELADRVERGEEVDERDQLRLRLHMLDEQAAALPDSDEPADEPDDEVKRLRAEVTELKRLIADGADDADGEMVESVPAIAIEGPKVVTPSEVVPPPEVGSSRKPVYADDWKVQAKRNVPVIDAKPEAAAPGGYDYKTNDSWKGFVNSDGSIRSKPRGPWDP
jgi:hypothetical protein